MDEKERRRIEREARRAWSQLREQFHMDEPDWAPLEKALPLKWCAGFMYMGRTGGIHLYKHGFTRHYLNLDSEGNAYRYLPSSDKYVPMNLFEAIEEAFEGIERLGVERSSPYDDEARRRKHEALAEAGWSLISVGPEDDTPPPKRTQARRRRRNKRT
jgi:hypothetical protein